MPFKVPKDIESKLKNKYPNLDVVQFINDLFNEIMQKSFAHGSCSIRELGRFIAFQTYSSKLGRNIVRFKFRPALSLTKKIKKDTYLLSTLPVKTKHEFNEKNEENCQEYRELRNKNEEAIRQVRKSERKGTQDNLVKDEIRNMLDD
ncbi:MAG: hypothetical protein ACOC1K_01885 [Nanoarchaeota archaeon]